MIMMKQKNSGQALLVILLIMAVALTIGLAVVSRSITDIRISQEQEESARAFSAAEAGLESLLATGGAPGTIGNFTISTAEQDLGNSQSFVFREGVDAGDVKTVWLVGHNSDGDPDPLVAQCVPDEIRVFWGNEGTPRGDDNTPALEATVFYYDSANGSYETRKYTSDPNNSGRATSNGFSTDNLTINPAPLEGVQFAFRKGILNLPGNMYVLRLKLIYSDDTPHRLGAQGVGGSNPTLPLQGTCYESTAESEETGITSRVEQCQYYPSLPGLFDYVLFSESSL